MTVAPPPIACPGCDILLENIAPPRGQKTCCPRCDTLLYKDKHDSISKVLAISSSGLLIFIPAIFLPLMTLSSFGLHQSGSIYDTFITFYQQGYFFVAIMLFLTSIVFPLLKMSLLFCISLMLKIRWYSSLLPYLLRFIHHLDEWAMTEIYLLGIFITIIKVYNMADIHFDTGFFCFLLLVLATIASTSAIDHQRFWYEIESMQQSIRQ